MSSVKGYNKVAIRPGCKVLNSFRMADKPPTEQRNRGKEP